MCKGNFLDIENETLLISCENGCIYSLEKDWTIMLRLNATLKITSMVPFKIKNVETNSIAIAPNETSLDALLCAGHFSSCIGYINFEKTFSIHTEDWIVWLRTSNVIRDGRVSEKQVIVAGSVSNTIEVFGQTN